ncbi:MAG: hypothetical protein AB7E95_07640 [Kiritimatiellales bacterium]|jgi:uncharacterized protein involved in outer membrane biogenesis
MKKVLSIIGIVLVVLIVVLMFSLGAIIKTGVTTMGPKIAGVPMELKKVVVNPLSGVVHIKGLIIGNPEGFHTDNCMELGEFKVDLKMSSLLSDTIVIKQILINEPAITYEKSLKSSNLATLQKNLTPEETAEPAPAEKEQVAEKKKPAKKVVIEDFQLNGAKVNVTITALGGKKLTLPLPPIHMTDIGKDSGGASPAEVISEVFSSITGAVTKVVASAGDIAGDALKSAGGVATDAAKGATDAAKSAADSIKKGIGGLLGK